MLALGFAVLAAAAPPADAPDLRAVVTYESAGLYWTAPGGRKGCRVRFREQDAPAWRDGLDLWYDARNDECRGSLVHLAPGTAYEAQLGLAGGDYTEALVFRTWAERYPVARTLRVLSGSRTLEIKRGGSPSGYVVFDGQGAVIDVQGREEYDVFIDASYVIVRNLVLRGARQDAIRIADHATDVIIEDNDISGWGRARGQEYGHDLDSGIHALCQSCPEVERVVIQRNRIHDPRFGANSWSVAHPEGPQAITFGYCGGNHVIRHNVIWSGAGHKFNDGIGGEENFSTTGFPNADSDIYANSVSNAWDDGIEAEGGNRNVRIWGNYIDDAGTGIATTITSIGPVYLFRNIFDRNRFHGAKLPDQDERQPFFKAGSDASFGDGRRYVFHNSMVQRTSPEARFALGGAYGIGGTGASQPVNETWSFNNLWWLWKPGLAVRDEGRRNRYEHDVVVFGPGASLDALKGAGRPIPNFNDREGAAPDVGAGEGDAARLSRASRERRPAPR